MIIPHSARGTKEFVPPACNDRYECKRSRHDGREVGHTRRDSTRPSKSTLTTSSCMHALCMSPQQNSHARPTTRHFARQAARTSQPLQTLQPASGANLQQPESICQSPVAARERRYHTRVQASSSSIDRPSRQAKEKHITRAKWLLNMLHQRWSAWQTPRIPRQGG